MVGPGCSSAISSWKPSPGFPSGSGRREGDGVRCQAAALSEFTHVRVKLRPASSARRQREEEDRLERIDKMSDHDRQAVTGLRGTQSWQ